MEFSEPEKKPTEFKWTFLISGVAIGWLVGLSLSPVLASVLGVILSLLSSAALFTPRDKNEGKETKRYVHPTLVMVLTLGIAFGASSGLLVRSHFDPTLASQLDELQEAGLPDSLAVRLLEAVGEVEARLGFYGAQTTACSSVSLLEGEPLRRELMKAFTNHRAEEAARKCDSNTCLEQVRYVLCGN